MSRFIIGDVFLCSTMLGTKLEQSALFIQSQHLTEICSTVLYLYIFNGKIPYQFISVQKLHVYFTHQLKQSLAVTLILKLQSGAEYMS